MKSKFVQANFYNFTTFTSINIPYGIMWWGPLKCGPDPFNRFDVIWLQTNKQADMQSVDSEVEINEWFYLRIVKLTQVLKHLAFY